MLDIAGHFCVAILLRWYFLQQCQNMPVLSVKVPEPNIAYRSIIHLFFYKLLQYQYIRHGKSSKSIAIQKCPAMILEKI